MGLLDIFRSAAKNEPAPVASPSSGVPLADQDIVSHTGMGDRREIINFREIVRDGRVPDGAGTHDYSYDPRANDTYNAALKQIEDNTVARIQELQRTSPQFQALMAKEHWTKNDRDQYDETLARIVSSEIDKFEGFRNYRTIDDPHGIKNVKDAVRINDLSSDLATGKSTQRFDCGVMSLTEGIVRQRIEDNHDFVPKTGAVGDYKKAMAFHYASGGASGASFGSTNSIGGHAFILTPTMAVIEGTANAKTGVDPFRRVTNGITFEQFANGKPLIFADGTIYGGSYDDLGKHQAYRNLASAMKAGLRDDDRTFTLQQLQSRGKIPGFAVALASTADNRTGRPDLVMVSSCTKVGTDENFEIKVYKIHDVGSAQEGYSLAGYQAARKPFGTADAHLSAVIATDKKGGPLKFDADFSGAQTRLDVYQQGADRNNIGSDGYSRIATVTKHAVVANLSPPRSQVPQASPDAEIILFS